MKSSMSMSDRVGGVVRLLVVGIFLAAGSAMLAGMPWMVELFARIGIGQWFRYLTGGLEITGCALLLNASTRRPGALLLLSMMLVAICTHVFVIGGNPTPAIVLAIACGWISIAERRRHTGGPARSASLPFTDSSEVTK
ncbi:MULTISPECIES: DoxX family protein [unclassified Burkholderia]|uniref:DoxX family protein n=1 Tax=unclassified Burkholderia TaxID=2613784 RepID=UPI000F58CE47|nr:MULTISPECIES: DoxX family protein [unclassified Burkholderia]RQR30140.1 DoxX family protein [Burkholderia sp. Bp9142]RQR50022.1 DoxX family protein [Burkholderia sp. Bp9140]